MKIGILAEQVRRAVTEPPTLTAEDLAEITAILCTHQPEGKVT